MKSRSKVILVSAVTAALLAGGGGAFAYWTSIGSGSSTASTGTVVAVTVNQTSSIVGLAPGLSAQTLSGNFDNPNSGPVYIAGVTATVTGTDKSGCTATDYVIGGTATVGAQVAAGTGVGSWSGLTIQFNNKGTNQDACKGAVVSIAYTAN